MKNLHTFEEFLNESLNEASIQDDVEAFADDLVAKGIASFSQRTSTGSGALGKFVVKIATDGKSYDEVKSSIEKNYKNVDRTTSFSSQYYFSPAHKLYFYFYENDKNDRSYKPQVDKNVNWDYKILVMRQIPKSAARKS